MSMKANIIRDAQGNVIVHMQGELHYENSRPLREELQDIISESPYTKVTIDLGGVDFVGASGICYFVETLKLLREQTDNISLSNVQSEFLKVFKLYDFNEADFIAEQLDFDNDNTAQMHLRNGVRGRTFEN